MAKWNNNGHFSMARQWRWRWGTTHTARWTGVPPAPRLGTNASLQLFFFTSKGRFKGFMHPKSFGMHFMMWIDNYWLIFIHRSCRQTFRMKRTERHGSRNIEIHRSLWVDNLCDMSLSNLFISIELFLLYIYILIYKKNAIYGYKYDLWFTSMVIL